MSPLNVAASIPLAAVGTRVFGATPPRRSSDLKVTATPETGLPLASRTITDGGGLTAVPTGADVPPPFGAIDAAAPAPSAIGLEVAGVSPVPPPKLSV